MRIIGRPAPTPMPRADLRQTDPRHASYVFGKEEFLDKGVNEALARAKESGEFDGKDGYTPVKGKDYFDGKDGLDGVSPVVSATEIEGGHRVTTTDKNGTKTFDVMDGKAGKTPVKGTDYFTVADKAEMVNAVIAALPTWEGGSY